MVQSSLWSCLMLALVACGGRPPTPALDSQPLPASVESAAREALLEMDRGTLQVAREQVEAHLTDAPQHSTALVLAGRLAEALLDHPRALAHYRKADLGDDAELLLRRGTLELDAGELPAAASDLGQAQQLQAEPARLHYQLGRLAEEQGDLKGARDAYVTSLGLAPGRPEVHFGLARVSAELGEQQVAERAMGAFGHWTGLHRLAKQATAEARAEPQAADKAGSAARALYTAGEFQSSARWARRALSLDPEESEAELVLALALLELGDSQAAAQQLDALLVRVPGFTEARRERAWMHLRTGDSDKAIEAMATAVESAPDDGSSHFNQGLLFLELGRSDEALAAFDTALALDPSLVDAHLGAAQVCFQREDFDQARAHWERCLVLSPGHPGAVQSLEFLQSEGR